MAASTPRLARRPQPLAVDGAEPPAVTTTSAPTPRSPGSPELATPAATSAPPTARRWSVAAPATAAGIAAAGRGGASTAPSSAGGSGATHPSPTAPTPKPPAPTSAAPAAAPTAPSAAAAVVPPAAVPVAASVSAAATAPAPPPSAASGTPARLGQARAFFDRIRDLASNQHKIRSELKAPQPPADGKEAVYAPPHCPPRAMERQRRLTASAAAPNAHVRISAVFQQGGEQRNAHVDRDGAPRGGGGLREPADAARGRLLVQVPNPVRGHMRAVERRARQPAQYGRRDAAQPGLGVGRRMARGPRPARRRPGRLAVRHQLDGQLVAAAHHDHRRAPPPLDPRARAQTYGGPGAAR